MNRTKSSKSTMTQFSELPKQVQKAGMDIAMARYEKHYHPRNKHHKKHLIIDIVLAAIVALLVLFAGYIFLFYQNRVLQESVELSFISYPESVRSGDLLAYDLLVENNTGQSLSNAFVEFPQGGEFIVASTSPQKLQSNTVQLGTLDNGESAKIQVIGSVISDVDSSVRINAIFRFDKIALLGTNEKFISQPIQVLGSSLTADIQLPESIVANQPFDFKIIYKNESEVTNFEQVSLLPNWPPGWEIIESSLNLDTATDYWFIESVGSLEEEEIVGKAILRTPDLEEAEITLQVFTSPKGLPLLQNTVELSLPVKYPNVLAEITSSPRLASLGQLIEYEIRVQNNESYALNNVRARLEINRGIYDPQSYPAALDERSKTEVILFGQLNPNTSSTYVQSLRLRSTINAPIAFGQNEVTANLPLELLYEDENGQEIVLPVQSAKTALNSDLVGRAFARYFSVEGDQIGRGPIPPIVGETTKYWVFVHLDNQLHPLTQVNVSGRLPQGVNFTGKESVTEGGALTFNDATRFFQWPTGELVDYKNNFEKRSYGAAFEVAITPGAEQIGEILTLLESIEIQGRDTVTGQIITVKLPSVTTNLIQDAYTSDEGKVTL